MTGGAGTGGCVFCDAQQNEQSSLIVFHGRTCFVILNLFPYNNGHLMVVPIRHLATFGALSNEEINEIGVLIQRAETALTP